MAEVHVVGQLVGASEFDSSSLFCKWAIVTDDGRAESKKWRCLEGSTKGQTQVDVADEGEMSVWCHPIDVHFSTTAVQGWPKMHFEVWSSDDYGRITLAGYGFCHVPTAPGVHEISVATWRPATPSWTEVITSYFLGDVPQLKNPDLVWKRDDRFRLRTVAAGTVHLRLSILTKDFEKHGVHLLYHPASDA